MTNKHKDLDCSLYSDPEPLLLESGQTIEILIDKIPQTYPAWLNFAATSRARNKIRHYLSYLRTSAARKLGQLNPNQKILLVDAQLAGEGASSRNSGYLVDTTLNDGFTSNKELDNYKKKADIYKLGIEVIKKFIKEYQVDCDWNECGKYFASSKQEDRKILENFSYTL